MDTSQIAEKYSSDATRLMDILLEVQDRRGWVSPEDVSAIATKLRIARVDIEQTLSFYHFFRVRPSGKNIIYLNTSVVADMMGRRAVAEAFERAAGCRFGEVSADGAVGLFWTADIGMNDQEPAALINGRPITCLTPDKASAIVAGLRAGRPISDFETPLGDGGNALPAIRSMVRNNIRKVGPVVLDGYEPGSAVRKALSMTPEEALWEIKRANLRGRGGAGFPVGMKWEFCRKAPGERRYVVCNADEGEPGTFKDRVLLTERARMMFDGMVVCAWAIGAHEGIVYLRGEYGYLKPHLESVLEQMRREGMLGKGIGGKKGFDFDIRIQLGAGAYVCGEESGLLESAEGKRGEPRNRPPFPAEKGYRNLPTVINNVETFCCAARIVLKGHEWFRSMGTDQSPGTKVLSISGDCARPGVYEVAWGTPVNELIDLCGADKPMAVQVGGASGICVPPSQFGRKVCYSDLATGGSVIVIGTHRDLFAIIRNFLEFFADESCGVCIPCRAGSKVLLRLLDKVVSGHGVAADLDLMRSVGAAMRCMSRCGLGQTAANPVVTTIENFRELYDARLRKELQFDSTFDMTAAIQEACTYSGHPAIVE